MRKLAAAIAVLCLLPVATAADLVSYTDPVGDVHLDAPTSGPPYSGPVADGVDLVASGLSENGSTVQVWFTVKDLGALGQTAAGVQADTMLFMEWTEKGGARDGPWTARADYQPGNSQTWSFWAEGPCLTPPAGGGCAGGDRDIHDGLQGTVDAATNRVTVLLPANVLGGARPGTAWSGFLSRTDAVWPSYPIYIGDSAQDLAATTVFPFGSASNATGAPTTAPHAPTSTHSVQGFTMRTLPSQGNQTVPAAPTKKATSALPIGVSLLTIALIAVLRRRD